MYTGEQVSGILEQPIIYKKCSFNVFSRTGDSNFTNKVKLCDQNIFFEDVR